MLKRIFFVLTILLCLLTMSCSSSLYYTGTNPWNVGIRTGVTSHYYSYSGP